MKNVICKYHFLLQGLQTSDEIQPDTSDSCSNGEEKKPPAFSDPVENDKLKNIIRSDVPECSCFPPDKGKLIAENNTSRSLLHQLT